MVTSISRDESILQLYPCNVHKYICIIEILKYRELIVKIEKIPRYLFYDFYITLMSDIIIIKFESLLFIDQSLVYI